LAIGLSVLCAANQVKAATFVHTIHGDDTTFHLLRDMCEAIGSLFGQSLLKTLSTTAERNKLAPIPILVFAECTSLNSKERELTPRTWGYRSYRSLRLRLISLRKYLQFGEEAMSIMSCGCTVDQKYPNPFLSIVILIRCLAHHHQAIINRALSV
jgi:hypothetical protein